MSRWLSVTEKLMNRCCCGWGSELSAKNTRSGPRLLSRTRMRTRTLLMHSLESTAFIPTCYELPLYALASSVPITIGNTSVLAGLLETPLAIALSLKIAGLPLTVAASSAETPILSYSQQVMTSIRMSIASNLLLRSTVNYCCLFSHSFPTTFSSMAAAMACSTLPDSSHFGPLSPSSARSTAFLLKPIHSLSSLP